MDKKLLLLTLLLIVLPNASHALEYNTNEYIDEFSENGEECNTIDIFEYHQWNPKWWDQKHLTKTIPTFYYCCKDDYCTTIIVDLEGKQLMKDDYYRELIDLNFIKYSLSTGNLTETSFVTNGIDSCKYHGKDKLNKESLNFVADAAEKISATQKTKQAKAVTDCIRTAKSLGAISSLKLADLGLSVICSYNNEKINIAIEKLTECNLYLSNIKNHYAETGYVNRLDTCLYDARYNFKEYQDDDVAKAKNIADKTGNWLSAGWKFLKDIIYEPQNAVSNFRVEETEYEIAEKIYDEIKNKKLYLHNPNKEKIFNKYAKRINQKREDYNTLNTQATNTIQKISNITPDFITITYYNIFYEPNFNLSEGEQLISLAKKNNIYCNLLYSEVKYNSAIKCSKDSINLIIEGKSIIDNELEISRNFDNRWEQFIIAGCICIIIFLIVKRELKKSF